MADKKVKIENLGLAIANSLNTLSDKALKAADRSLRAAVINSWTEIIVATPVDKGQARASWIIGPLVNDEIRTAAQKNKGAAYVLKQVPNKLFKDNLFLFNNMPYINKLEYGGYGGGDTEKTNTEGYSKLAPTGMVRINMAILRRSIKNIILRLQ